jgi:ABC-type Zn uptake system ZnuABC Zn-binding protein ZnuA
MRAVWVGLALAGMVTVAGCDSDAGGRGASGARSGQLQIVTTVSPITNIVQNIVGDRARVTGIVPEGVNSHEFEPAPSDARVLADADVIFINGLHLEEPTRNLAEKVKPT